MKKICRFYTDGFRSMTVGRTLWAIILLKLFVMFGVLKLFLFRDPQAGRSAAERSNHLLEQLIQPNEQ